jgi:hypothetical protein
VGFAGEVLAVSADESGLLSVVKSGESWAKSAEARDLEGAGDGWGVLNAA